MSTRRDVSRTVNTWKEKFLKFIEDDDDDFEILDLNGNGSIMQQIMRDLKKSSTAKQMAIGGTAGLCSGYLFCRVGRAAAGIIGGTLLLLQLAHYQGYVTINWTKMKREAKRVQKRFERRSVPQGSAVMEEVRDFMVENMFLASSFAGGFLLGVSI